MDIFGFFQHFRCKFSTVSKFSDYVHCFKRWKSPTFRNFPIMFHLKGWTSPTFRNFTIMFPFERMENPTFRNFPIMFPFQRMEIPNICDGHFRFFPTKLNSMRWARSSDLCHTSLVFYPCATLLLFRTVINKINK
jgi:hypothetical protein